MIYLFFKKLKRVDNRFKIAEECIGTIQEAKKELKRNCAYIEKHFRSFPNYEVTKLMERNFYLLSAIAKNDPCNL